MTNLKLKPSDDTIYISWTAPNIPSYDGVVVLRHQDTAVTDKLKKGEKYVRGDKVGSSEVIYAGALDQLEDKKLTNGTVYHYRVIARSVALTYAPGVDGSSTPRDKHPGTFSSLSVPVPKALAIMGLTAVLDSKDQSRVLVVAQTSKTAPRYTLYYGACAAPCATSGSWNFTVLSALDRVPPVLQLIIDSKDRLRMISPTYGECDASCDVSSSWKFLPGIKGQVLAIGAKDKIYLASSYTYGEVELLSCEFGCSTASSWKSVVIDTCCKGSAKWPTTLSIGPNEEMALIFSVDGSVKKRAVYLTQCRSSCLTPANWITSLNVSDDDEDHPRDIHFTTDGKGTHMYLGERGEYYACDACSPKPPSTVYTFPAGVVRSDGRMLLVDQDQPRIFTFDDYDNPKLYACDYLCNLSSQWVARAVHMSKGQFPNFSYSSNLVPVLMWSEYNKTSVLYSVGVP